MIIKIIKKSGVVAILVAGINAAHATGQGAYFGLMLGQSNLNGQNQTVTIPPGPIPPGVSETVKPQGSGIGTRLFAGYNMNQYAALEAGFTYYSSMSYKTPNFSNNLKTRAGSFELLGKGMIPFADTGFGAFAKLGGAYFYTKTNGKVSYTGTNGKPASVELSNSTSSVFRPAGSIGVSYEMTQNWVADLSYNTIFYSNSQIKNPRFIALGLSYHLLDPMCGQFLC